MSVQKPLTKPKNPCFSSGPCAKRPDWSLAGLDYKLAGRSHRSKEGKAQLKEAIDKSKKLLGLPEGYVLGIVPASDTGAVEMAMWSLLGPRGVDVFSWESFGQGWASDILKELKLKDVRDYKADYGQLPDLSKADFDRDVIFCWNGTTSGVCVPNADWIKTDRQGLVICDATSSVFAMPMDWTKLDVVTYSWQKALGGEAAHGVIILSPRAVERLQTYTPPWPMPKIFKMTKGGKLLAGIFEGETINTPSMLCVLDLIDALDWVQTIGGSIAMIDRSRKNFATIEKWVNDTGWIDFLASDPKTRSTTSVCLKFTDAKILSLDADTQDKFVSDLTKLLDKEGVAYDIKGHRDGPPALRFWAGGTVEAEDLANALPWVNWAYAETYKNYVKD